MFERLAGLLLLTTPFLIGWGVFIFLSPATFWECFATMLIVLFICVPLGVLLGWWD